MRYVLVIAIVLGVIGFMRCKQPAAHSYAAQQPETQFVGSETCASCHKRIYDSYQATGMGKSMYRPSVHQQIEDFGADIVVTDAVSGYRYHPFWKQDSLYVKEFRLSGKDTVFQRTEKVDYVVGSGNQTRSYLMERNGYFYEFPITWYVSKKIWDLSPGYDNGQNSRFSREIGEECMACHTGIFTFVEGSKNRFRQVAMGIDCENCHGPGAVHIKKMKAEEEVDVSKVIDYSIVNPEKLPLQKQFDVCQQCHLQGTVVLKPGKKSVRDFRPSMALAEVFNVFVEKTVNDNEFGIASHADRLQQSQCFIASNGKLTCTTCHDPHKSIHVTDTLTYNQQCQNCHQQKKCTAPTAEIHAMQNQCVKCHMPAGGTKDIPHVRFHDHKIRVVANEKTQTEVKKAQAFVELVNMTDKQAAGEMEGEAYLSYFETHNQDVHYLSQAEQKLTSTLPYAFARLQYYKGNFMAATQSISTALSQSPQNGFYLFLQGEIAEKSGDLITAQKAYQTAYQANPEAIEAGIKSVTTLLTLRQGDRNVLKEAETQLQQLLTYKPFDVRLLSNYGFVMMNQNRFAEAEKALLKALSYDETYVAALQNIIALYQFKGEDALVKRYEKVLAETKLKVKNNF